MLSALHCAPVAEGSRTRKWATTAEVATAAGRTNQGVMNWVEKGVLPGYEVVFGGKRGRSSRWPLEAPAQAAWVRDRLDEGHTFDEIKAMLAAGEFKPPPVNELND